MTASFAAPTSSSAATPALCFSKFVPVFALLGPRARLRRAYLEAAFAHARSPTRLGVRRRCRRCRRARRQLRNLPRQHRRRAFLLLSSQNPTNISRQNAQHTPNLYARFLHQLVAQRKQDSTASPDSTAPARTELQYFDEGSIDAGGTLLGRDAFSGYLTPMRYSRAASEDWVASLFQNDAFIFGQFLDTRFWWVEADVGTRRYAVGFSLVGAWSGWKLGRAAVA